MQLLIGGPPHGGNVLLASEDQEKGEFFEMLSCPGPGVQMLFGQKRRTKLKKIFSFISFC